MRSDAAPFLLCLGFGRIAEALVRFLIQNPAAGWRFAGTTRSADKAAQMRARGIVPLSLDGALAADALAETTHILLSIPPGDDGDPVWRKQPALAAVAPRLRWTGYLSTTGVYGDLGGRWAFEWIPTQPISTEGRRRELAERQWLSAAQPAHIFRLPGLYGPGRSAFDRLRDGTARRI
ncbi:MAG: SDR family NAD(P)-dependent oxidoreductase, partial [Caulobacterales bacterium]